MIFRLTSPSRLRIFGVTIFLAWCVVYAFHHVSATHLVNEKNVIMGRDFMSFYIAGTIVKEGDGKQLYNPTYQQQVQDRILAPEKFNGLAYYINPASVAVVNSGLARLPYRTAFHLHTLLMLLCFAAGIWILKPCLSGISSEWWVAGLLGVVWFPMMNTIMGGQNAALTFLLLAAGYAATAGGRQWLAGLALGLLLFKPQYALPLLGLLMLRKQWLTIGVAVLVGASQYLLGAYYCGWHWPVKMTNALAGYYHSQERIAGGATHISIMETLDYSIIQPLERLPAPEWNTGLMTACGYGLVGFLILYLIWTWRTADPRRSDFGLFWALATSATLLISLHTQYYDISLLFLPLLQIINHQLFSGRPITFRQRIILIAVFMIYPLHPISEVIRFQPLILLPIGVCAWAVKIGRQDRRAKNHEGVTGPA